jgi:uncharacterized caspase-like protein
MRTDDYAIVVGIASYPGFGRTETEPRNLRGPDHDAQAVYDWITSPAGGDVDPANVTLVRSADYPAATSVLSARPAKQQIVDAFERLDSLAQQHDQVGQGLRVGRRLYLYLSGHGFAPRRKEAAVFAANATRTRTHHVFGTSWQQWFGNAEYFDELVLWMDCCMVFDLTVIPEVAGYRILQGTSVKKMFSAYAARYPQQAVERPMPDDDNRFRGVFTYTLLKGLREAVEDPATGQVTSASLKNYLYTNMKEYMTPEQRSDPSVSQEPDFGFDDPMVFCQVGSVAGSGVTLTFPAAAEGRTFRVVTGAPIREVATGTVQQGGGHVRLPPGLYFVKVDGLALASGFEVTGASDVRVNVA